jgi:hypothetical protein
MTQKEEWLQYSGFQSTKDDRWLRARIADLFEKSNLTPRQTEILTLADRHLTFLDLPMSGDPKYDNKLRNLARSEFGQPPTAKSLRALGLRFAIIFGLSILVTQFVLPWVVALFR